MPSGGRGGYRGGGRGRGGRGGRGRGSGATVIRHNSKTKNSPQHPSQAHEAQPATTITIEDDDDDGPEPDPHTVCLVCYDATLPHHRAILPCGHDDICGSCHLRLRYLNADRRCPVCKTTNDRIIVDVDPAKAAAADNKPQDAAGEAKADDGLDEETHTHKPFDSYEMWGDELGKGYTYRDDVGMFFPTDYYVTTILPIFSLGCGVPNCHFTNESDTYINEAKYDSAKPGAKQKREIKRQSGMQALNTHLRTEHNLTLCNLCYMAKRDFVSQLPRFTPSQLKTHQTSGDGAGSGFTGHPLCEFCRPRRFYDLTKLHEHLNKEHYKCHVCDKQGRPNQFFKNYNSLARHFDREHFLCQNPMCLSARFVVFENEIALRAHERSTHGATSTGSSKINLEFNVRGSHRRGSANDGDGNDQEAPREEDFQFGLDGEAFVPEALPNQDGGAAAAAARQENEPEITHAAHAERTAALRAEAAQMRQAQRAREQAEAFPTLGGDTSGPAGGGGSMVGWTADGRAGLGRRGKGQLTKEDFPALAAAPKKKSIAARALRPSATGGSARGSAASVQWSSSTPASRAAAAAPSAMQSQAFFTPGPAMPLNRRSNLAAENFPSLGGGPGSGASHASANVFAARKRATQPTSRSPAPPTGAHFPSLSATTTVSAQAASQRAAKERLLGANKPPSQAAMDNMMNFPPPRRDNPTFNNDDLASGMDTVRQMKAALGPTKYKELKRLTNYYAAGEMNPDAYVDMSSALFDKGVGDSCFWKYMPRLIDSCPNARDNAEAMKYMENLRVADALQKQEDNVAGRSATQASVSGYAARSYTSEGYTPRVVPGKKKGGKEGWKSGGGGGNQQQQQSQKKKPAANNSSNNGNGQSRKAKAKAKNNELKALAFGGGK